jgi:hypothetical protein
MFRSSIQRTARVLALSALLLSLPFVQTAPAQTPVAGTFNYKADKISLTQKGVRLDGNAQIIANSPDKNQPPQLDVRAGAIAFDILNNQITQLRARTNVRIKVTMTPKGGGEATRIEATANEADLDPPTKTLKLRGNIDGFYQAGNGPRFLLSGNEATLTPGGVGSFTNPKVIIPTEASGQAGAIGTVTITSQRGVVDQKAGTVRFIGDARAISTDGPNKFDVAAPELVLTRGAGNTIDTLKGVGRTSLKIDLPPDPPKPAGTPGAEPGKLGKPTRVEVESDEATVNRTTNTMIFTGNVKGFYFLMPAEGEPQKYDFSGTRAEIKYIPENQATAENPAGLRAEITGAPNKPVEVLTPAFNIDLSG